MSASMAYLSSEGTLIDARRNRARHGQFSSLGLRDLDVAHTTRSDAGRDRRTHSRLSSDHSIVHNDRQHDIDRRNKHANDFYKHHIILCSMGSSDSSASDRNWSGSDRDGRRCGSDHETAWERHANSATDLPAMPHAGQPIRCGLSELSHPPLSPVQILSATPLVSAELPFRARFLSDRLNTCARAPI